MAHRFTAHAPFCLGVGTALCFWFMLIGYTGSAVIDNGAMPVISALGVTFILYLAWKITTSEVDTDSGGGNVTALKFQDGLLMQLLNPKSFLVVLPVAAVQFPALGITGAGIAAWSAGLGALGFGAPFTYAAMGSKLSKYIENARYLKWFNILMGAMLVAVALDMAYNHIFLALT